MTLKTVPFQKLDSGAVDHFLNAIRSANKTLPLIARNASGLACPLGFFPGWRLIDMTLADSDQSVHFYCLSHDDECIVIDHIPDHLKQIIRRIGPLLTLETVADYVRFYFFFAHSSEGRLRFIESADDFPWSDEPGPSALKALSRIVKELIFTEASPIGSWQSPATFLHGRSLFSAIMSVHPNGDIDLNDRRLEVDHLPVLDDFT